MKEWPVPREFIQPSMKHELGEIDRIKKHFQIESDAFAELFRKRVMETPLTDLTEELWNSLENTDSTDITTGDWDKVDYHTHGGRSWETLRNRLTDGTPVDAPVIAKFGNRLHLVSGNTRLMVSKALGIVPQVAIVDISDLIK